MKSTFLIFIFLFSLEGFAQGDLPKGYDEFLLKHSKNSEIVYKMLAYDHVAWVSSDSVKTLTDEELKTYGGQWFCYMDSIGQYHALYGAYDSTYRLTAHYIVDSTDFKVKRSFEPFDTLLALQYSKAFDLARSRKIEFLSPDDRLRYNHFIFRTDTTISVHFVPAYQPSGYMVYGAEQHYTLNNEATQIIDTLEYFREYRGYLDSPNKDITITYEDMDYNSIGALFYLMYYQQNFKSISILTKDNVTSFIGNIYYEGSWIHAIRSEPNVKKKEKKKKKNDNP